MKDKWFFGWANIKWLVKEFIKIYSNEDSYFSKKRIESGVAFAVGQWGMIFFLLQKYTVMSGTDFGIWAGIEFAIAGYVLNQIQKEKRDTQDDNSQTGES